MLAPRKSAHWFAGNYHSNCLSIVAAFCLLAPQLAHSRESETAVVVDTSAETETGVTPPPGQPIESELTVEGLASYGHYKIFASGSGCKLYTGGFEYDRHSWGYFLGARVDYVAEFLPLVLLRTADTSDIWALQPALPEKPCLESAFHR